ALADDHHLDVLADRSIGDNLRQIAHFLDVLAVKLDDDISRFDAGRLGRALFIDAGDHSAACRLYTEALGDFIAHPRDAHPKPATAHFLEFTQLVNDRQRRLRRNGKADANGAPGRRDDSRVHADHLAVEIEQRSARIAAIDGGVSLDVIVVRPGL